MRAARLDHRDTTPDPRVREREDEASRLDAFVKALLARRPVAVSPYAEDGRALAADRRRGVAILARSLFRDLVGNGFEAGHIVALSAVLVELTTSMVRVRAASERERLEAGAEAAVVPLDARHRS